LYKTIFVQKTINFRIQSYFKDCDYFIMLDPTDQLYRAIGDAYNYFNAALFEDSLPKVIFTVQRKKGIMGYFSPDRWGSKEGKSCHEIALNPAYLAQSRAVEIFQTLVHEMVHCWQYCHGSAPRAGYHNKEWAYKMMDVGLMPSSTGNPGGSITGQNMSDYILEDGAFNIACSRLVSEFQYQFNWVDRFALPKLYPERVFKLTANNDERCTVSNNTIDHSDVSEAIEGKNCSEDIVKHVDSDNWLDTTLIDLLPEGFINQEVKKKPTRYRYICPNCDTKIYGKPKLKIKCVECDELFQWNQYSS
jgi:predicted SprT family Zn-dependent metalloprotease